MHRAGIVGEKELAQVGQQCQFVERGSAGQLVYKGFRVNGAAALSELLSLGAVRGSAKEHPAYIFFLCEGGHRDGEVFQGPPFGGAILGADVDTQKRGIG